MADSDDLTVRVIRDAAGLQTVREAWRALAATLDERSFVHLYEWYESHFVARPAAAESLHVVTIWELGTLVAVLPLQAARRSVAGLPVRVLEFAEVEGPLHDVLLSGDVDGARIVTACRTQLPRDPLLVWDVMRLHGVLHGRQGAGLAQRLAGWPGRTVSRTFSNYIDVSDERCFARLSAKQRYKLRRHKRSLEDSGRLEFVTVAAGPGLEAAFDEFVAVEGSGWKSEIRGQRALKLNPERLRFYAALRERLACHVHLMRLNGETLAGALMYTVDDTVYEFKIGYDERFRRAAPGHVLKDYIVRYYIGQPAIRRFSFITYWDWHRNWRPERAAVSDCYQFNFTVTGVLSAAGMHGREWLKSIASRVRKPRAERLLHEDQDEDQDEGDQPRRAASPMR